MASLVGSLRGCYPCILCGNNYLTKEDFENHLFACAEGIQRKIMDIKEKLRNVSLDFQLSGNEEARRLAGYYNSEIGDLTFRLQLLGMNSTPYGLVSPRYSGFFYNMFCPYCCRGFRDQDEYQLHRHACFRTTLELKNILFQKLQERTRELENAAPERHDEVKTLNDMYCLISFKLNVTDGVPCTEHRFA